MQNAVVHAEPSDQAAPAIGPFASAKKRAFVLALLLVVCTLALYNQANHFSFINYDDNHYVTDNPHVQAGLTRDTMWWALTSFDEANWHPLTWMSHALDCQLFHLNPAGHHFTSILLHAFNVLLVFLLLARVTGKIGPSFFVAALFALHPLNVESVAWVAERKNVLSTMFFLMTIGAYGWYALKPGWKRYGAVAGLLACGLASKPMLVTTPFVLLLLDYWPLGRIRNWSVRSDSFPVEQTSSYRLVLEKLPLLLLAAASSVVTIYAQRAAGAIGAAPFPLHARLENGVSSYAAYLWKTVWPTNLALFYPYAGRSLSFQQVALAALLLIAITAVVVKLRSRGYLVTGWLWFLGTLVPVIGVVQVGNQAMADRYAYIPLMGIFVMLAWLIADLAQSTKISPALQAVVAIGVLAALSFVSYRQIGFWRNSLDLWAHSLKVTQHNYVAEENMGVALVQLNRVEEAYPFFVQAAQDEPNDPVARVNIGAYLHQHGHQADAIPQYQLAIQLGADPRMQATIYSNLGAAYSDLGDNAQSRASFEHALQLDPHQTGALQGMVYLAGKAGNLDESIRYFARFVEVQPSGQGYLQLAQMLAQANRRSEAEAAYEQAVRIEPDLIGVQRSAQH